MVDAQVSQSRFRERSKRERELRTGEADDVGKAVLEHAGS